MTKALLELSGITQRFKTAGGTITALDDVTVTVPAGSALCLVGESGSGKTTLARIAAGLDRPSEGQVLYQGKDISKLRGQDFKQYRRDVQYVHQDPYASLNPTRTVFSTLRSALQGPRQTARERCSELLERVELTPPERYLDKYPHQLSGGQRQRVALARALATDPHLIIADETTSMLDASIRGSLLNLLGRLRAELDVAFVFITHDFTLARHFAWQGETAVLYLGRVVESGRTPNVMDSALHPYTKALIAALPRVDDLSTPPHVDLKDAETPSLLALPSGCTFHTRCPIARDGLCDATEPALDQVDGNSHWVACHLLETSAATDAQGVRNA